jgi:hypothetical protein
MLEGVNAPFFQKYLPNPISNLTPIVYYLAIDSFFHSRHPTRTLHPGPT